MSSAHIAYTSREDATAESEATALTFIYARAIERYEENHARKKVAPASGPDDAAKGFWINEKEKGGRYVEHLPN